MYYVGRSKGTGRKKKKTKTKMKNGVDNFVEEEGIYLLRKR